MRNERGLSGCPFCGGDPKIEHYPTMIRIFCVECESKGRTVKVVGDGHYSEWCRAQKADENGIVRISAELNPVSDVDAFNRVRGVWNDRKGADELRTDIADAVAEEREACARACDPINYDNPSDWTEYAKTKAKCAALIRERPNDLAKPPGAALCDRSA